MIWIGTTVGASIAALVFLALALRYRRQAEAYRGQRDDIIQARCQRRRGEQ